ncbi:mechanosensitive ion channel domain-containing protein [Oryzomicrobium sp.]|uniref:mechanosensitive ion channel domain-containing protein n=1 Tax=Oryzomicrobium sp. TaxID=1911578 RepID=UPI0025D2F7DB|nr:mechanosensitive ion channel domain-containing protein [Oryzomicrobium sp.]MCE1243522.1 mechanosensitive ion channel [Oryzomicrobium sp.]
MPTPPRRLAPRPAPVNGRPRLALALGLILAGAAFLAPPRDAAAQGALVVPLLKGKAPAAAKAETKTEAPPDDDELAAVEKSLAQAHQALTQSPAGTLQQANAEERLERQYLIAQLARSLERQRDTLQKLRRVQQQTADQETQSKNWKGFDTPPPYSALLADQLRDSRDNAQAQARAAEVRQTLLRDEQTAAAEKYKAAQVQLRQLDEKQAATVKGAPPDPARQLQHALAELRSKLAAQSAAEADAAMRLASAEVSQYRSQAAFTAKQLDAMRGKVVFSQADLDTVLAELDKEHAVQEAELARQRQRNANAQRALDDAEKALLRARERPAPPGGAAAQAHNATLATLAQTASLRRIQLDNAHLAYDTLQSMISIRSQERQAWQYRWMLMNGRDAAKLRETSQSFTQVLERIDSWIRYLNGEIDLAIGQANDYQRRLRATAVPGEEASLREFQRAYQARADIYREALQVVSNLQRTLRQWQQEFDASRGELSLADRTRGWATTLGNYARLLWNFELFTAEDTLEVDGRQIKATRSVTVGKSIGAVLLLVLGYVVSAWLVRRLRRLAVERFGVQPALAKILSRWGHFILLAVLFVISLDLVKIPLTVFAFLGGALAIGFGFGAQNLLKNLMSGIMLLIERPLRVGDLVEVGNVVGTVTNISIRSSIVRNGDGIEILIPNSSFLESNVINWTYSNARVRRSIKVGVDYGASARQVSEVLLGVAARHGQVLKEPAPRVLLEDFGADALMFNLEYWIDYAQGADGRQIGSDLRFMIERAFADAGIGIPFPQRVVHIQAAPTVQENGADTATAPMAGTAPSSPATPEKPTPPRA